MNTAVGGDGGRGGAGFLGSGGNGGSDLNGQVGAGGSGTGGNGGVGGTGGVALGGGLYNLGTTLFSGSPSTLTSNNAIGGLGGNGGAGGAGIGARGETERSATPEDLGASVREGQGGPAAWPAARWGAASTTAAAQRSRVPPGW